MNGERQLVWNVASAWWHRPAGQQFDTVRENRVVEVDAPDFDFSTSESSISSNVFEAFHYSIISKDDVREILSYVYEQSPADDEIVVIFTDFRVDDLFNTGAGTGPINIPVKGIGAWQANPNNGTDYGSEKLLVSMAPVFVGALNFRATGTFGYNNLPFNNHAPGVSWIAHEAVHRWAAHLDFQNPNTDTIENLLDNLCRCHWNDYLHTPVAYPVWSAFAREAYDQPSTMGGRLWIDNDDGTFTQQSDSGTLFYPKGLSAIDLYVMGMLPANEVPETFILRDVEQTDRWDTVRATKVPVRIEDIVAAMGQREPSSTTSKKEFRLGVYLLHEQGRGPHPSLLARAQGVVHAVGEYFDLATGGRMKVRPTLSEDN